MRGPWPRLLLVAVVLSAVVGVAWWKFERGARPLREVHDGHHGILSATMGSGGVSIYAPRGTKRWGASFGGHLLCVTEPGASARIERIRQTVAKAPLSLSYRFRRVPLESERVGPAGGWFPFDSARGIYPQFASGPMRGAFGPAQGTITQPCDGPQGVFHQFTELVTEMKVDRTGGRIVRTLIDYTSGGKKYTLVVNWTMTACGSQTPEDCERA